MVRPVADLVSRGVIWDEITCSEDGSIDLNQLEKAINPKTKVIMVTHASNVCGTMLPIEKIGAICKKHNVFFCIDAAQTAGGSFIDMKKCKADVIVLPGHKGIMGPQGIGVILMSDAFAEACKPIISGGTGSLSYKDFMPDFMPDKFQPGTMNIPGIIGMGHGISFIQAEGIETIEQKKIELTTRFISELLNMKNVKVIGKQHTEERCAVVSLDFISMDNGEVAYILENEFGIMTRCGIHCAPHAHKTLGTFPKGTVRFLLDILTLKKISNM